MASSRRVNTWHHFFHQCYSETLEHECRPCLLTSNAVVCSRHAGEVMQSRLVYLVVLANSRCKQIENSIMCSEYAAITYGYDVDGPIG